MVKNLRVLTALFGFSLGLVAGTFIEEKMAIRYSSVHVNINHEAPFLVKELRNRGYGVTVFKGKGRDSTRYKLEILTKRKKENLMLRCIKQKKMERTEARYGRSSK